MPANDKQRWWGEFAIPADAWGRWIIGPMTFWARPTADEWRLAWHSGPELEQAECQIDIPCSSEPDSEQNEFARFAFEEPGTTVRLAPRLADLPIVVRPETPLWIPPGQRTVLYVGTLAWIAVFPAGTDQPEFMEIPIRRPSDTWFGANTRYGELCYASRTRARTRPELLGYLPHRAITPVEISNMGGDVLNIAQLRIPVMALGLYETADARLWTDGVRFTRKHGLSDAEFDILHESQHIPDGSERIDGPRAPLQRKTVIQAFSAFFK